MMLTYQHEIYAFALYMLHHPQDAEDITQEVFMHAYRVLKTYDLVTLRTLKLRAWLFTITHHLSINCLKTRRKYHLHCISSNNPEQQEYLEIIEDNRHSSPEDMVESNELHEMIHMHIHQLSPKLRAPVILHYILGLSYSEVASILQLPVNTAKSAGRRGVEKLRMAMKEKI